MDAPQTKAEDDTQSLAYFFFFWTVGLRELEAGSDMIGSGNRGQTSPKGVALEPPCGISCITATTLI